MLSVLPVSVNKNTPPKKRALGEISLNNIQSRAVMQFPLKKCKARARTKGVLFPDTDITVIVTVTNTVADVTATVAAEVAAIIVCIYVAGR